MDYARFFDLLKALNTFSVDYVLVGGVAMNLHGIIRMTEDIDLFIRPTPENVKKAKEALRSIWQDDDIDQIAAEDLAGEYSTIRYGPPEGDFVIDLIGRLGTAVSFEDLDWESIEFQGIPVRIATPAALHRMKKDTVREVDRMDAAALRDRFGLKE